MRDLSFTAVVVLALAGIAIGAEGAMGAVPAARQTAGNAMQQPPRMPSFPLMPGSRVFGPEGPRGGEGNSLAAPGVGHARPGEAKTATRVPTKPTLAEARAHLLDDLFARLARATDPDEAKGIAGAIERVWMHSGSATADLLMHRAMLALNGKDYSVAERVLDAIVVIDPGWSEGWDKRATERFLADDYTGAMADISHVLAIEPRHFGALSAMGFILEKTGFDKQALQVFRKVLKIYPQQKSIRKIVDDLTIKVEGRPI